MRITELNRLLRINKIFVRHQLDEFVVNIHLFRPYRLLVRLFSWRKRGKLKPRAVRLRLALEELGPIFVKFGQIMSTRPDLLPEDIAKELSQLQDNVPPIPGRQAITIIEQAYGGSLSTHFKEFEQTPLASASVAQVHLALLHDGTEVAVKVLRPGIDKIIERDLALLYHLARLATRFWPEAKRLRLVEVVDEFNKTIHNELDLLVEAANASQLRANFEGSELLYVPKVYWDHSRRTVMVMERIEGIIISDITALQQAGINMRDLAHHGVEIFFTQAFRDGFFHADMHPGNIFVSDQGQYRAVDFGIMGSLNYQDKRYLAEIFLSFFNRDYKAISAAHVRAGWVPKNTNIEEFETAIRTVCEPIFAKPIKDISFGRVLLQLFHTARRFQMEIQPQLVLLQKTLFNIEGLGRRLYPDLDLWQTAKPYLEAWMRRQLGPSAFIDTVKRELPKWWQIMPEMPGIVHGLLEKERDGKLIRHWQSTEMRQFQTQIQRNHRRLVLAILAASLFIAAAVLLSATTELSSGLSLIAYAIAAVASIVFVLSAVSGRGQKQADIK